MRLKNEGDSSLLGVLMIIALISAILAIGVWGYTHDTHKNNAREYFGISNAFDLSDNEKIMLRPMVSQQLKILKDKVVVAARVELRFGTRSDISPATADKAVAELRAVQGTKKEAARNLATACKTARYFSLISKESEWRK